MMRKVIFFLAIILLAQSCNKKVKSLYMSAAEEVDEIAVIRSDKREDCNCNDADNYAPDDRFPQFEDIKFIRTNFHYPNTSDKTMNYIGQQSLEYSEGLLKNANLRLKKNKKMNLPEGNETRVYDAGYRYKLVKDEMTSTGFGIYEDVDEEHWYYIKKGKNKNNYDRTIIKKHKKNDDSVLNIFAMVYHPDSLKSKKFKSGPAGIALGNSIKIAGVKEDGFEKRWILAPLLNHEIGHVFGLRHSWYKNDGCDDTPPNANCWSSTKEGKCAGVISNNMMDYNHQQSAITPCQIGLVKKNMHREKGKVRKLLEKDWCEYNIEKSLIINENTNIDRAFDMKGDIIINDGASLRLSCRVHMPKEGRIIVHPNAMLILNGAKIHNDCGDSWAGIEVLSKGKQSGIIEYLGEVTLDDMKEDPTSQGDMD